MTVISNGTNALERLNNGWVEVSRPYPDNQSIIELAHPDSTCLKLLKGGVCVMDKGHRGRCTTVAYCCDACGQMRRGQPHRVVNDSNGDPDVALCFMCVRVDRGVEG